MYDIYNAAPACIIYSYSCPYSVCTYVHPCLAPAPPSLCVCVPHIPIHIHSMCTCVPYSTRSVPHHTVPQYWYSATPLTHLHVRSQVHLFPTPISAKHNMPLCMSSSHPLHIRYTSGTGYMAYAITRSVAYNATLPRI